MATDGHSHELFIQNIMILRNDESGDSRAAISLFEGQIALYDTTIESNRHKGAPAMVMDSASAFITRTCLPIYVLFCWEGLPLERFGRE